jgi:hypothetical protein
VDEAVNLNVQGEERKEQEEQARDEVSQEEEKESEAVEELELDKELIKKFLNVVSGIDNTVSQSLALSTEIKQNLT